MNTSSPKSKKTSLFSPIYFLVSLISNFLYNKLPQEWSPSTKKGVVQISGALAITCVIVSGVAFGEAILKEDETFKTVSQFTGEVTTQDVTNKNNQNNQDKNKNNIIAPLAEVDNKKQETRTDDTNCNYKFNLGIFLCPFSDSKLLGQVQNIGVIAAAILFFLDVFDRKKQLERQAWQLIDGAQGSETSGARKHAIEDLYEEKADITGLDADGADLRGINLSGADLTRASFKKAILEGANFEGTILEQADFTGANLRGANLKKAKLWGANFTGAKLHSLDLNGGSQNTDLRDANLGLAKFNGAKLCEAIFGVVESEPSLGRDTNLTGAYFGGANLKNVNLKGVDIADAHFAGAKNLDRETFREAKNYEQVHCGQHFSNAHVGGNCKAEQNCPQQQSQQHIIAKKILEITQRLTNESSLSLHDEDSLSEFINLLNYLVLLLKELDNQYFLDNEIEDIIINLKRDFLEKISLVQEAEKTMQESDNMLEQSQKDLQEMKLKSKQLEEESEST